MDCKRQNSETSEAKTNIFALSRVEASQVNDSSKDDHSGTSGRWTVKEHLNFIEGVQKHGRQWKVIQAEIPTRTSSQIRTHAQKFFLRLKEVLKCNDAELMKYICSKPASYFVNKGNKFARLGYEEAHHCPCVFPENDLPETGPSVKRKKEEPLPPLAPPPIEYARTIPQTPPIPQIPQSMGPTSMNLPTNFSQSLFPVSPAPYSQSFIANCTSPSPDYFPHEAMSSLYQLEQEGRVLGQELAQYSMEIAGFCQKITADWTAGRATITLDTEVARDWSYLCTQGMALQRLVKRMNMMHTKLLELISLHKIQIHFPAMPSGGIRQQQPEMCPRYLP